MSHHRPFVTKSDRVIIKPQGGTRISPHSPKAHLSNQPSLLSSAFIHRIVCFARGDPCERTDDQAAICAVLALVPRLEVGMRCPR